MQAATDVAATDVFETSDADQFVVINRMMI